MAAAARSAEAHVPMVRPDVVKPWLGSTPQAGKLQSAVMRERENPYAKFSHLKALADRRGVELGHALGISKKAVRNSFSGHTCHRVFLPRCLPGSSWPTLQL